MLQYLKNGEAICWHTMASTVNRRKTALQLCSFLIVFFVLWTVRVASYDSIDATIASATIRAAYSNLLKIVLWVVPAWVFASCVRRSSPANYLGLSVLPSLRNWLLCFAITASFLLIVALVEVGIDKKSFSGAGLALPGAVLVMQFIVSPLVEEILFRGLVMKELMSLLPPYWATSLTSLLFLGAHLPYWLTHGGPSQAILAQALGVFVFSIVACGLYARTASIWPPTLAHTANNIMASALVTSHG